MSAFSLSKLQPEEWLATVVTAALTWPLAVALCLANRAARTEETASDANATPQASNSGRVTGEFDPNERFTQGYFGRYRW